MQDNAFMTVEEAAEYLGIGRHAAYGAVRSGQIPSIRIGKSIRVPRQALRRLAQIEGHADE